MHPIFRSASALALFVGLAIAGGLGMPTAAEAQTRYSMATASPTSGYYRLFAPVAEYINKNSETLRFTPLSTDGSLENCRRVGGGDVPFGMCTTFDLPNAWRGKEPFAGPQSDIRVIGPDLDQIIMYFMVRKDSGVESFDDLAGKAFGCGAPGSSATQICKDVLTTLGLIDKVEVIELPFDQLGDLVANRDIVGMARGMIGLPASFAEELNSQMGIRMLSLDALTSDPAKLAELPAVSPTTIPAGTYDWHPEAIQSVSIRSFFIVHKSVPEKDVYEFTRMVNSQGMIDHMASVYSAHGFYPRNKDPLAGLQLPLHPGAMKFWKEAGVKMHAPALSN